MEGINSIGILFYLPGILFLISGLPQTWKLWKTKSSKDISLWMYILTDIAVVLICVDAYQSRNTSILVSNLASLFVSLINTFLIIWYRRK